MYINFIFLEPGIYCTAEALEIISNGIGQQKDPLISRLGLSLNDDQEFAEQLKTVKWSRLSLELERMERVDLVRNIKQNTLVTEGKLYLSTRFFL